MTKYPPAKTGGYPRIYPNFQNCARCVKDLKDNKHDSLHLGRKYARIFVLGHYLFLEALKTGCKHSRPKTCIELAKQLYIQECRSDYVLMLFSSLR